MTAREEARTIAGSLAGRALGGIAAFDRGRRDVVAVLTYHRIVEPEARVAPGIASATRDGFAEQMAILASAYHPISLDEFLRRAGGGPALPRRSVLVTFDDGYVDTASVAWPILRAAGIPAAVFVPTALPDSGERFWWTRLHDALRSAEARASWSSPVGALPLRDEQDRLAAYRRLRERVKGLEHDDALALVHEVEAALRPGDRTPGADRAPGDVLGWSALETLAAEGMELAAHTRTHPLLTRVSPERLDDEIRGSIDDLATRLLVPPTKAFAYPSGAHSATVREAVARNGIEVAFTTDRGLNDLGRGDWLAIRRINVGMRTDRRWLQAQLGRRTGPLVTAVTERREQRQSAARTSAPTPAGRG